MSLFKQTLLRTLKKGARYAGGRMGLILLFIFTLTTACNKNEEGQPKMPELTIEQVQKKHENDIMKIPGVVGIGIGLEEGKKVIKVFVVEKDSTIRKQVPENLDGYPIKIEVTGKIRAM